MQYQVTALRENPPGEEATRPCEEDPNTPFIAIKDRWPCFNGSSRERSNHEPGDPIRRILVPTDFSPCSASAVERAVALTRQCDATLTILHVIDINPPAASTHCGPAEDLMRQLWVTGASELSRLTKALHVNRTKTQTLIVEGLPAEAIVEHSSGFDLLVIGEERSKSAGNLFSRHTARRVVERAECPVLVVHERTGLTGHKLESKANVAA